MDENALSLLLKGFGYSARLLEYPSAADAGEQPLLGELEAALVPAPSSEPGSVEQLPSTPAARECA